MDNITQLGYVIDNFKRDCDCFLAKDNKKFTYGCFVTYQKEVKKRMLYLVRKNKTRPPFGLIPQPLFLSDLLVGLLLLRHLRLRIERNETDAPF